MGHAGYDDPNKPTPTSMKTLCTILFTLILAIGHAQEVTKDTHFNSLIRSPNGGWIAGDGTFSIPLPEGNTLWLFGDSFIGTVHPDSSIYGATMIRNCAIWQQGDSMQAIFRGAPADTMAFIPTPYPDSIWFWPEQGIMEHDTLKVFMAEYTINDGPPGWNYDFTGTYLVYLSYPGFDILKKEELSYYAINGVMYGTQLMAEGDYTYIYGRKDSAYIFNCQDTIIFTNAHLARVSRNNLTDPWEFYTGSGWSSNPASSHILTTQPVSQQYAVFKHLSKYVLLTQESYLGKEIYSMTADHPEGPWGNRVTLYTTPVTSDSMWTYNALAHPQFNEDNKLLVSYNTNGAFDSVLHDVEFYRPTFLRVPFGMIDSSFAIGIEEFPPIDQASLMSFHINPNPVSSCATISFDLPDAMVVSLKLYNLQGKQLSCFINRELQPGHHEIEIDMSTYPPGIYLFQIANKTRKVIKY
jgi:hypothetical protein